MIHVSSSDLDAIASSGNSIHLTFFGLCAGAAISFWGILAAGSITDAKTHAECVMLCFASVVLAVYFGIRGGIDHSAAKRKLKELKGENERGK